MKSPIQILVVEDESIVANDMRATLEEMGYAVAGIASTGEQALRLFHEKTPDMVLLDIVLQGEMDGVDLAKKMKEFRHVPIIYLTAFSDEPTLERIKQTVPYGYLQKPFHPSELYCTIETVWFKYQMEQKLKEREEWFYTTLKSIGDAVITTDNEGRITFMNSVAEALTGWTLEEALHRPLEEVFRIENEVTGKSVPNPVQKVLQTGRVVGLANHTILISRDGRRIPLDDSGSPIRNEKGEVTGVVLVFKDITERKKAEKEIHDLARFPSQDPNPVLRVRQDGVWLYENEASQHLLKDDGGAIHRILFEASVSAFRQGQVQRVTLPVRDKVFGFTLVPIVEDGYVNIYGQDITDLVRAQEALQETEQKFRDLFDNAPIGYHSLDENGVIVEMNNTELSWLGYTREEVVGKKTIFDLETESSVEKGKALFEELQKKGHVAHVELEMRRKDGSAFPVLINASAVYDENGRFRYTRSTVLDISIQKQAERILKESEMRYRTLVENIGEGIAIVDPEERIIFANPEAETLFGVPPGSLVGCSLREFVSSETFHRIRGETQKRKRGEKSRYELEILRPDGEIKTLMLTAVPLFDLEGHYTGALGVFLDITERKKMEQNLHHSLYLTQTLLREIHHRVKNNMQVISSLLNLQAQSIQDPGLREKFRESQYRIRSMALLHEKLYRSEDFSKIQFPAYISTLVTELLYAYRRNGLHVDLDLHIDEIPIDLDHALYCGLIVNELVSNALKHAFPPPRQKGKIGIQFRCHRGECEFTIEDDGIGLPESIRLEELNSLGLRLVSILVADQLNGTLDIIRDKGTRFVIRFKL